MPRQAAALALALLATAGLMAPLWKHYRVDALQRGGTQAELEQALALQPGNAELHNRLGRLLLLLPLGDTGQAGKRLEEAARLDPRGGIYWVDLALAREMGGDLSGAAEALGRARQAEPRTPMVLWHESNFLLRRGENERALEVVAELLRQSPDYTGRALAFFARVVAPGELIARVAPDRVDALEAAMEFARREGHVNAAPATWERLRRLDRAPNEGQLRAFVDWLLARGQGDLALRVWHEAGQRRWLPVESADSGGLYNGGFQRAMLNFGFDWRVEPHPDASVWIEARGPQAGMESLCVQFSESARAGYAHVRHWIPVEPNAHYSLRGALRSEKLYSRAGAFLEVADAAPGRPPSRSDSVTGTSNWREILVRVETGAASRLAQLALVRPGTAPGEEPASGLVCVADLKWQKLGPARGAANP